MPSNKARLYIAIHPSGVVNNEERKYHWAFLIGPKEKNQAVVAGIRCHVKNTLNTWKFEEASVSNIQCTTSLLGRILVAKITDQQRLLTLLRQVPVVQGDSNWRCRTWVANALDAIARDGTCVSTAELDWQKIEALARQYVGRKTASGRYNSTADWVKPRPTWDMLDNKEVIA
ncbi:hypothetical protein GGS24DRAFT_500333 [Hypoxylon argillaceum]|nr:hypothetical protein GGS24DRAFT_500333 [Hypoxylon argillaceum]